MSSITVFFGQYLCTIEQLLSQNFGTVKITFAGNILSLAGSCRPYLFVNQSLPDIGLQIQTTTYLVNRLGLGPPDGPLFKEVINLYLYYRKWSLRLIFNNNYHANGRFTFLQVEETGNGNNAHVQIPSDHC